ncbi:nitrogenase component 1 [Rhizobium beringeri]
MVGNWSGDATRGGGARAESRTQPHSLLSVDELHLRHMEEKYGIPWMEYNFFGGVPNQRLAAQHCQALRAGDQEKAEKVIVKYQPLVWAVIDKYWPRLSGKQVMLYVGGLRPRHVVTAYEDLGMEIVGTGYGDSVTATTISALAGYVKKAR